MSGCVPMDGGTNDPNDNTTTNENDNTAVGSPTWGRAFDGYYTGALTSVWGSDENNVFAVGGQTAQCEIYQYNGTEWRAMGSPQGEPILAWIHGFSATDMFVVGEVGGVIHYNGTSWTPLDSGTDEDLWGAWGTSSSDLWIVGGNTRDTEPPVILHYNGTTFTRVAVPENDRNATALFGIYGVGNTVFAVGSLGLIIKLDPATGTWSQVNSGPAANQDFLGIYGTSEDHFIAVGGRAPSGGRIAMYDGSSWDTFEPPGVAGLSTVFISDDGTTFVGGPEGYVGMMDVANRYLWPEAAGATDTVRGIWGISESSTYFVVGGNFAEPHTGVAVLRTLGPAQSGTQADVNQDGLADAPLTVDGQRPDDIVVPVPGNDNTAPPAEEIVFANFPAGGTFEQIEDGGNVVVNFLIQDGVYAFNPVVRLFTFPAEAANMFASYTYSISLVSSGEVIAEGSGFRPIAAALDSPGAFDLRGTYVVDPAFLPEDMLGQTIEFTVTVTYDGVSPPATSTITQTMVISEIAEAG